MLGDNLIIIIIIKDCYSFRLELIYLLFSPSAMIIVIASAGINNKQLVSRFYDGNTEY